MRSIKVIVVGLIALVVNSAQAGKNLLDVELEAKTGTRIEIFSVFDPLPPTGYAPVRVVGSNGASKTVLWNLSFECSEQTYRSTNRQSSEFAVEIGPHVTASRMLMVPMAVKYGATSGWGGSHQIQMAVDAGALGTHNSSAYDARVENLPAIAISKGLARDSMTGLKEEVEKRRASASGRRSGSGNLFGSEFQPSDLPEDWRGFSGFDVLMITQAEWLTLKSGAKLAVMQWVRLGGNLHLYGPANSSVAGLGLPADALTGRKDLSLGKVEVLAWNGERLNATETVARYWDAKERENELINEYTDILGGNPQWGLLAALGKRSFASWQVLVFLVVFGILVGPVNLFILAPPSRRHRLFVTTPLLSLGASLLMIIVLLVQDGVGGQGRRFVAINLEPADAAAFVTQEQACRTGILLSSGFELKQPALLEPLALPDTPWVKLKNNFKGQPVQIRQSGSQYSGNIFQSRAEQAQVLRAALSARSRLELKPKEDVSPDAAPEMISALGFTAKEVFYADGTGKIWKSTGAAVTGQPVKFAPSDLTTLKRWWNDSCALAGSSTHERLERQISAPRDAFFATAAQAPEFVLDTLKSIRWADDQVVVFGSVPKP